MKILHISKYYPPYKGGIEDICYSIVKALFGEEQKVICFNNTNSDDISKFDGVEVIRIASCGELASQPISFSYYFKLKKILKTYNPDIIHLHLPNPLLCLYVLSLIPRNTKLILHWHSDIIAQKLIYHMFLPIERKILAKADKILVTSPQYLDNSQPLLKYRNKCVVIPNVISLDKLELDAESHLKIRNIQNIYKNKKIIFFLGRHVAYKGIEYLIEAEKYIQPECVILIAGRGPLTSSLRQRVKSDRIKFIGSISDEDIKVYMNAATVFAFPSITKNEAFGVVLAEAMYCRAVPVCFTIIGAGVNWVSVNNQTGIEVENRNAKAFGEAISLLLTDENLCRRMAENAHQRVMDMFTMKSVEMDLKHLYKNLLLLH